MTDLPALRTIDRADGAREYGNVYHTQGGLDAALERVRALDLPWIERPMCVNSLVGYAWYGVGRFTPKEEAALQKASATFPHTRWSELTGRRKLVRVLCYGLGLAFYTVFAIVIYAAMRTVC